ncbi:hypothetical protein [Ammoniphilus sp. YIM 78166]|uniref:hypothetical protein n=1 Tax=Ammoniphilus sp. YIM 78166 TaxID=1644106 RepID=UPI00142F6923|nr:hypothetical protein [Ammoniphilus sp. YIM 78166]
MAGIPNGGLLEFDRNPNDLRTLLFNEEIEIDPRGVLKVPERPGLGVTLNQEIIDKYRVG